MAPAPDDVTRTTGPSDPASAEYAPQKATIGRYRVLGVLGEGGMGIVYAAEQDHPRRKVALKVIRQGASTPTLLKRFDHESQALGRLQHPAIAQIYEAGVDQGQPYFAMEFIQGQSLLRHANQRQLDTRQRVELMAKVADGVHHAHQRGIIHRDLKPGNILVDETGQPKILDFGVARVTDADAQATRQTDLGELVGTLAYMSPEQVLGDPLELDTRSDVYTLGLLLFELLAGRRAYTLSQNLYEGIAQIREVEPTRLSSVKPDLAGDIETITAKALEKDKTRRYASAAELSSDLRRWLNDEPITARPATATYQIRRFARRHKGLVGAVAAVILALAGGIVVSLRQAARADRERDNAQAIGDFLRNDVLGQASTNKQSRPGGPPPDPNITVKAALAKAAVGIDGKFKDPAIEASLRATIGQTDFDLGLYTEAEQQFRKAMEKAPNDLAVQRQLASTLQALSRRDEAAKLLDAVQRRASNDREKAEALVDLSFLQLELGKYPEADQSAQQAIALGAGDENLRQAALIARGRSLDVRGKYAEAEPVLAEALAGRRKLLGSEHNETLGAINNLAVCYLHDGKFNEALPLLEEVMKTRERLLGPQHRSTMLSRNNLAANYRALGRLAESEALLAQSFRDASAAFGPDHRDTLTFAGNVAQLQVDQGKLREAEPLLAQTAALRAKTLGPEHEDTLASQFNLAVLERWLGQFDQADALLAKVLAVERKVFGPTHAETLSARCHQGQALGARGRWAEAERLQTELVGILRKEHAGRPNLYYTLEQLGRTQEFQGALDKAAASYQESLEGRRKTLAPNHPDTLEALEAIARLSLKQKNFKEAEAKAREAMAGEEKRRPDSWQRAYATRLLGEALVGQGKTGEGAALIRAAQQSLDARRASVPVERHKEAFGS